MTRRSLLGWGAAFPLLHAQSRLQLGFSLYGMRSIPYSEALGHVARIGYKSTELCLRAGWNTEPKLLSPSDRVAIRKRIADLGLVLPSVMENLGLGRPDGTAANLERLRNAAEICHETSPGPPALIETTVGGRPGTWDQVKSAMAGELAAWANTAAELKTTVAVKAHSKTAMNLPERLLWLVDQVKSPWIRTVYDYSHFAANGLEMRQTMEQVARDAVFVHIKDTDGRAPDHKFLLPGERFDYNSYVKLLTATGYRGPVLVEVSVDVFDLPGYDPVVAAQRVWDRVSPAFR